MIGHLYERALRSGRQKKITPEKVTPLAPPGCPVRC
jgi:hypothetical protein